MKIKQKCPYGETYECRLGRRYRIIDTLQDNRAFTAFIYDGKCDCCEKTKASLKEKESAT